MRMRLKEDVKLSDFLGRVNECTNEVCFVTDTGDRMNLKSLLCRYVFLTMQRHPEILRNGDVECESEQDAQLLQDFLVQI